MISEQKIDELLKTLTIPSLKENSEFYIYILKCESEKYYVGKTRDLRKRLEYHLIKENCNWTKIHKPLKIEELLISDDSLDEDKWVKKYMIKKGINNVRGGSYCRCILTKNQIDAIAHEIVHSRGQCFYCLGDNHLVNVKMIKKILYNLDIYSYKNLLNFIKF